MLYIYSPSSFSISSPISDQSASASSRLPWLSTEFESSGGKKPIKNINTQ